MIQRPKRRGVALIMALLFITMFGSLAVALAALSNTTLVIAGNQASVQEALFEAEGGLNYLTYLLKDFKPSGATGDALLEEVADHLADKLNGSPAVAGTIAYNAGYPVIIPSISAGNAGRSFQAMVSLPASDTIRLAVTGQDGAITRAVGVEFSMVPGSTGFFAKGISTRGPIRMTGNAKVLGVNNPAEAECLSTTYDVAEAFNLTGNCDLEGGLSISNPAGYASLTGNCEIGGQSFNGNHTIDKATVDADPSAYPGFRMGVGDVEFPEVNPGVFESFATNIVDASTSTNGNKTFTNIRIKANTNKTFSGNMTFKGVIFIEQPNKIHFSGNTNITGVIVTEDAGDDVYETNTLKFSGNVTVRGVEDLPNTSEFHELRQMPGSFLLAPGFGVEFTGNFGTVNGTLAADKFKWTGNAGGVVCGSVISYSNSEFKLTGNSTIRIDRSGGTDAPPGFLAKAVLELLAATYVEY